MFFRGMLFGVLFVFSSYGAENLCSQIVIQGGDKLEFTDTEKRLVCGDPKQAAYKNIPPYQAAYMLKGFLQSRGYLNPEFITKKESLVVKIGEKTEVEKVKVFPKDLEEGEGIEEEVQRLFEGLTLTPSLLNSMESESLNILRRKGYPCVAVKTVADGKDGSVGLTFSKIFRHRFGKIEKEEVPLLNKNAFDRFYPFEPDDLFDVQLLKLTEKRMLRNSVVEGTYFQEKCEEETKDFSLTQQFILGPPRTIRFGIGISTEVGPMARVRWNHNRYGPMASLLEANLQASFRTQSLRLLADNYLWTDLPRRSLLSQFEIKRESQLEYEEVLTELKSHIKWMRDSRRYRYTWSTGPTLMTGIYRTDEDNANTQNFSTLALQGDLEVMAHEYEYFDIHPEKGSLTRFHFDLRHPSLGFSDPLLLLDFSFRKLHTIGYYGRGSLVGGLRINAATTWVSDNVDLKELPPSTKFYGGGSDDVRGFMLQTLPDNDGVGALSKLGSKFELRKTYFFAQSLEGFIFVDLAYFGLRSWMLEKKTWYSPGLGLRWLSPIGMVQGYVARGYSDRPYEDHGNFYYLGLGGTF